MSFIAGAFTATYNGTNIGKTRQGFKLQENHLKQGITTDDSGDVEVDSVQQGTEVLVELDYVDYNLITPVLYRPNSVGQAKEFVGHTLVSRAQQLILTPIAGTPAAGLSTPIYTFPKAIIESNIETLLSSKLREGPLTLRCYPDPSTGRAYTKS